MDVASFLWRDPRKTYEHTSSGSGTGALSVAKNNHLNRIAAYLHQKGLGTSGAFLRAEVERLGASFRKLNDFQSKGKAEMTRQDARAIALATFFLIGELAARTDLVPIEHYSTPAKGLD